eukprot:s1072_g9.t1
MHFQDVAPQVKKFTIEQWRQHVRQNHVPFRRDCRLCIEEMGQDHPHRAVASAPPLRQIHDRHDVAGPFARGDDLGAGQKARYALVATVPIPLGIAKKGGDGDQKDGDLLPDGERPSGDGHGPGIEPGCQDLQSSQDPAGPSVLGSPEVLPDFKECALSLLMSQLLKELRYQMSLVDESDVLDINDGDQEEGGLSEADQKVVQMNRRWKEHRDVATEPIEVQNISMMEPLPSRKIKDILEALDRMCNGRVEAELAQWKRRLRLTLKSARAPVAEWPMVGRHVMEERMRLQLRRAGGPADIAILELEEDPTRPFRRLYGKQKPHDRVPQPVLVDDQHRAAPDVPADDDGQAVPDIPADEEPYEPESPLDDTEEPALNEPADDDLLPLGGGGIFDDDDVSVPGEPAAVRALYYDDGVVPTNLLGGESGACFNGR